MFLPVRREALAKVRIDTPAALRAGVTELCLFAWSEGEAEAYARVFCPGTAVPADPATGSAALGLGVWMVGAGWLPATGTSAYRVRQGFELNRPALLTCEVTAEAGVATRATVAGHVVPIARGEIIVPPFVG